MVYENVDNLMGDIVKDIKKVSQDFAKKSAKNEKRIYTKKRNELAKEVSRMASMANKRMRRLERNELLNMPSMRDRISSDGNIIKFSVKGKDYNELQSEYWKLKHFLDNKTSTVKGATSVLKEIAYNTGIRYKGIKELNKKVSNFFILAEKIKQYYQLSDKYAESLDYQKIWEQINTSVDKGLLDLTDISNIGENIYDKIVELGQVDSIINALDKVIANGIEFDGWDLL